MGGIFKINVTIKEITIKNISTEIGIYWGWISFIKGAKLVNDYENKEINWTASVLLSFGNILSSDIKAIWLEE